jgi:hypothetical protein
MAYVSEIPIPSLATSMLSSNSDAAFQSIRDAFFRGYGMVEWSKNDGVRRRRFGVFVGMTLRKLLLFVSIVFPFLAAQV